MDRAEKRELVSSLHQIFSEDANLVVVTRNHGLRVHEVNALRGRMRENGAQYKVAKNRLARLALEGTAFEGIKPLFAGPTAMSWSNDPVAAARVIAEFANKNNRLEIVGGALGSKELDAEGVDQLAKMPSLDEARAQVVGTIQAPAQRLVTLFQEPGSRLARVLNAYADEHGGGSSEEAG